jgi:peptidoglycan hydrolase-like protein with peptidoglycan-binding domain
MATRAKRKPIEVKSETIVEQVSDRYPFRYALDTGDRGPLVLWAQSKLSEHGHYDGPLDGKYTRALNIAVRKFQDSKGLRVTGVIDRRTWDVL